MTWSPTVYVMIITSQTQHLEPGLASPPCAAGGSPSVCDRISVKWGVGYERATKMTERHTLIPHIRASTQRPEHTPIPLKTILACNGRN